MMFHKVYPIGIPHKALSSVEDTKFSQHTYKRGFLNKISCSLILGVSPYPILFKLVGDLKGLSGADHGLHGSEDVLVNKPDEASLIFV